MKVWGLSKVTHIHHECLLTQKYYRFTRLRFSTSHVIYSEN